MLHIQYQTIDPELLMAEHHYISRLLSEEQIHDLEEQRNQFMNPIRETSYGFARLNHITFTLGMMSMSLGLDKITEDNVDEWFFRLNLLERLNGTLLSGDIAFNRDDLVAHVGLAVNSPRDSRRKFLGRMKKQFGEIALDNAINGNPVKGSNYSDDKTGVVELLKEYQAQYGKALVGSKEEAL